MTTPTSTLAIQNALISVIMPAYNAGRFIGEAIESVLAQTYANWELIIVNDASSDNTEAIAKSYTDRRVRIVTVDRLGSPAKVRNVGLKLSTGEFIAFLDADDLYFPKTLEKLLLPLVKNPKLSGINGFASDMDENGDPLPQTVALIPRPKGNDGGSVTDLEPEYSLPPHYNQSWYNIITNKTNCQLPALMIRRQCLEEVGLFNETLSGVEDYEFYLRLYLYNYHGLACLSDYVYQYRIYTASLTKSPEHCRRLLNNCLIILNWLFDNPALPANVQPLRSLAFVSAYRYLGRERLLYGQPELCRELVFKAARDKNVSPQDFIRQCAPLLIRSFLPSSFDGFMVQCRREARNRLSLFRSPPQKEGS